MSLIVLLRSRCAANPVSRRFAPLHAGVTDHGVAPWLGDFLTAKGLRIPKIPDSNRNGVLVPRGS